MSSLRPPNFNWIARPYRWLEYLTFGPFLNRTRNHFLPRLEYTRRALILGDGDGRFTARLFRTAPSVHVTAVESSRTMLKLLRRRSRPFAERLVTHNADARFFTPTNDPDLIVTHFFIDCLTQPELDALALHLAAHTSRGASWLISEFTLPPGLLRYPTRLIIRAMYFAFRLLTGLRVTRLPDYSSALRAAGFTPVARRSHLFGILTSHLWRRA